MLLVRIKEGLTSLDIPEDTVILWCYDNQLTSIDIPKGVGELWCYNNQLTSLNLPEGVYEVDCRGNPICYEWEFKWRCCQSFVNDRDGKVYHQMWFGYGNTDATKRRIIERYGENSDYETELLEAEKKAIEIHKRLNHGNRNNNN